MSQTLRKRGREPEALPDSTDVRESKRFNGQETDPFCHSPLLGEVAAAEEECAPVEDFGCGAMRSLEEEISATSSTFFVPNSVYDSANSDISSGHEFQTLVSESWIDLCYLLEASDDELGIPPSPVLDLKDEVCQSRKDILTTEGFWENPGLNCLGENKLFKDDFVNNHEFELYEDACDASQLQDYMNRDFVSQDILFGGDFSAAWTLETAGCI
uniref:Uncharacterized protein n=1 Tax=Picea sitchensis TaxID=3332 RepID=D5ABF1_PICSI|nr:unknown [Picea sitchensis]